ncbi:hypothetical protein CDD83_566 [Cordyceps sp. RAO-2017]|nr:hypothetical protein CDD83_566 [Cordyceps sp. RAO-2017]
MPLDIPWLLRREQQSMASVDGLGGGKAPSPQSPEIIHNHYYTRDPETVPWYRRKNFCRAAIALLVLVIVASAVVLAVVLKLELGKSRMPAAAADGTDATLTPPGSLSRETSPPLSPTGSSSGSRPGSWSLTTAPASDSSSSGASSSTPAALRSSTGTSPPLNDTVIGIVTSFLATFSGRASSSSTSPAIAPSSPSKTSSSASSSSPTSSTLTSAKAAETLYEYFAISEKSQLASVYINDDRAQQRRRLLIWQDDKSDLIVTEWSSGGKEHFRVRDRAASRVPDAKHGTPLALVAGGSGLAHLFFLDTRDTLSHVFEVDAGGWESAAPFRGSGPIVAGGASPLSAAWHRGAGELELLGVAYQGAQNLRLALTDEPAGGGPWRVIDVPPLPPPVPGGSDAPCFSLAGDWRSRAGGRDEGPRKMMMAAMIEDGFSAWECSVDNWPPPTSRPACRQVNGTFQDDKGRDIAFVPPPQQLAWIRLDEATGGEGDGDYDFGLVSLGEDSYIDVDRIGAGVARKAGRGLDTKMRVRAVSTTDEPILFVAAGDDMYSYRLDARRWTWKAEGSLMPARGERKTGGWSVRLGRVRR